jgi:hypothetical protein
MHPPGPDTCVPIHDSGAFYLSLFISIGLLVSYLPQHARIVYYKSSEGIDPTFLLLGATSSASSLLNIIALSWTAVRCCPFLVSCKWRSRCGAIDSVRMVEWTVADMQGQQSRSSCMESLMGVLQIGLQWACFNIV